MKDLRHRQLEHDACSIKATLDQAGYVVRRQWRPDTPTSILVPAIGLLEHIPGIPLVHTLRPTARDVSMSNLYSGNFGLGEFPLHTDLAHWFIPPRYVMLRCVKGDARTFTAILSWSRVLRLMPALTILRARFRARTPVRGRTHLLPFTQGVEGTILHRWDSVFLVPDNDAAAAVATRLRGLASLLPRRIVLQRRGDTLILDNWRVLHGRSAVREDSERLIERSYIREIHNHA